MNKPCNLCERTRIVLPSGVLVCVTCDTTPTSTIPVLRKTKP